MSLEKLRKEKKRAEQAGKFTLTAEGFPIRPHEIDELRQLADRAKLEGHFDEGRTLHELLDAYERFEQAQEKVEELQQVNDLLQTNSGLATRALEHLGKLKAQISDLKNEVERDQGIESPWLRPVENIEDTITDLKDRLDEMEFSL